MAPDLGASRGSGARGSPQEFESRGGSWPCGMLSPARAIVKYAAVREELRVSVGRRGASLGRPRGAVGVLFGSLGPSGRAPFPGCGMGRGPEEGPGRGGRLT